jgi:hypothetical protein
MQHEPRISRRQFLIAGIVAAHGLLIDHVQRTIGYAVRPSDAAPVVTARVYCPLIVVDKRDTPLTSTLSPAATPSPTATLSPTATPSPIATPSPTTTSVPLLRHHVVHTYSSRATFWNYSTGWYGDSVDARVVAAMVDEGVTRLTRTATRADAWAALLPHYQPGQRIGIKVNFNNADRDDNDNEIDALMDPINAVIAGLLAIGVAQQDIWIFDVSHGDRQGVIPLRFKRRCSYPDIQYASYADEHPELGFSTTEKIRFNAPPNAPIPDLAICNALVNLHYSTCRS